MNEPKVLCHPQQVEDAANLVDAFSAKFTDNPNLKFQDISDESGREYVYPGGHTLYIDSPLAMAITKSSTRPTIGSPASHRVVDSAMRVHYVTPGWLSVSWKTRSGCKPCKF